MTRTTRHRASDDVPASTYVAVVIVEAIIIVLLVIFGRLYS